VPERAGAREARLEAVVLGYLTNQYGRASDTFIRQEVTGLRERGHQVHTFSIRRPDDYVDSEEILRERASTTYLLQVSAVKLLANVVVRAVRYPRSTLHAIALAWNTKRPGFKGALWQAFYFVEAAWLARCISREKVEHVHNHIGTNSASVCMLAARMAGVSWSMTVHGPHDFVDPSGWAFAQKLQSAVFSAFISEFARSQAMWHSPATAWPRFHIVRCGLDRGFLDAPATPVPQQPRFVFVGRLAPEKGVTVLMDAVASLGSRGIAVQLVIIGDGPYRGEVEQRIVRGHLQEVVKLLGWQSTQRVREEILASRALVLPSFAEGLPIVLMEALALHRPAIATQIAGIPELVEHGVNGWLVPPGSVEALCGALHEALEASPTQLGEMGKAGAARVRERHDASSSVAALEALFAQAARGRQ
jgi:colanic acid/amylovoran biosynthesis glycosyltransferase